MMDDSRFMPEYSTAELLMQLPGPTPGTFIRTGYWPSTSDAHQSYSSTSGAPTYLPPPSQIHVPYPGFPGGMNGTGAAVSGPLESAIYFTPSPTMDTTGNPGGPNTTPLFIDARSLPAAATIPANQFFGTFGPAGSPGFFSPTHGGPQYFAAHPNGGLEWNGLGAGGTAFASGGPLPVISSHQPHHHLYNHHYTANNNSHYHPHHHQANNSSSSSYRRSRQSSINGGGSSGGHLGDISSHTTTAGDQERGSTTRHLPPRMARRYGGDNSASFDHRPAGYAHYGRGGARRNRNSDSLLEDDMDSYLRRGVEPDVVPPRNTFEEFPALDRGVASTFAQTDEPCVYAQNENGSTGASSRASDHAASSRSSDQYGSNVAVAGSGSKQSSGSSMAVNPPSNSASSAAGGSYANVLTGGRGRPGHFGGNTHLNSAKSTPGFHPRVPNSATASYPIPPRPADVNAVQQKFNAVHIKASTGEEPGFPAFPRPRPMRGKRPPQHSLADFMLETKPDSSQNAASSQSKPQRPTTAKNAKANNPGNQLDSSEPHFHKGKKKLKKKQSPMKKMIMEEMNANGNPEGLSGNAADTNGSTDSGADTDPVKNKVHSQKFRDYCENVLSSEIDECARTVINSLSNFQDRLKDSRDRRKRRIVCGLKEVRKLLKVERIKCIVMAPDIMHVSRAGGLDDVVSQILACCKQQKVPYVFALSKTELAKLTKKLPGGVSVVGIVNPHGIEEHMKKLLAITSEKREEYEQLISLKQSEEGAASSSEWGPEEDCLPEEDEEGEDSSSTREPQSDTSDLSSDHEAEGDAEGSDAEPQPPNDAMLTLNPAPIDTSVASEAVSTRAS